MNKIKKHCAVPFPHPSRHFPAARQHGMTIIEVLVSMLILGLGVLVLLATQLRTAAGVREAEQQTIVSQEVQNLIEGMLANPTLSADTTSGSKGWTKKSYEEHYINASSTSTTLSANSTNLSKSELANMQVSEFRRNLKARLPDADPHFTICFDTSNDTPTISSGAPEWKCNGDTSTTVIKVLWQVAGEGNNNASGVTINGDRAVYTYQARITD